MRYAAVLDSARSGRRECPVRRSFRSCPTAITAIQAMVAPGVLITTAAILSGALLGMYGSVNDRMRAMDRERLETLTGAGGTLLSAADVPASGRERLTQIDAQLPMLLRRHRLIRDAVLLIFAAVAVLVLGVIVIVIAVAVTNRSGAAGTVAPDLVLAGTVTLLGGLLLAARSIMVSAQAIDFEVQRSLSLGS